MKKLITLLSLLMVMVGAFSVIAQDASPPPPEEIQETLDTLLGYLVIEDLIPAAALLVITPDWTYEGAIGTTELGGDEPVTIDMQFQIGSNTKMMTSVITLQLHEEGLLDVDDLLSTYLPDVASRLPNGDEITIRQMLKMRSGLFDYVDPLFEGNFFTGNIEQGYTYEELVDYAVENGTPEFAPDSLNELGEPNFDYSNTGYLLLGMIIEEITGQPLNEVYAERIFQPLGMENTYYETGIAPEGTTPRGYYPNEEEEMIDVTDFNLSAANAAGAVISTPQDMATFISALLNGELYQDSATLELMQSDPKINSTVGGDYALGIRDETGDNDWGHGGQTLAFQSDVIYNVNADVAMVVWVSSGAQNVRPITPSVMRIIEGLESTDTGRTLYLTTLLVDDEPIELSPEQLANYTITFNDDLTISVMADCNQGTLSYQLGAPELLVGATPITLVTEEFTNNDCGPDSISTEFTTAVQSAETFASVGAGSIIILGNTFYSEVPPSE